MQQWCGLITGVNIGGLFSKPCIYVRMDPSEAKHSEADIKLCVNERLAPALVHVVPGQTLLFDAKFTEIGYWFHHEMDLVGMQALPRAPKPAISLDEFEAVRNLPHDARVRQFYVDFHGRSVSNVVVVREDLKPDTSNFATLHVPCGTGRWNGYLDIPKQLLMDAGVPLPLLAGTRLVVTLKFEGLGTLKVTSVLQAPSYSERE